MGKPFFEVFSGLSVQPELEGLMKGTEVTKVSTNHQRNHLRVYLQSGRLIEKADIYHLEQDIKAQLFPKHDVSVKIIEKFCLSGQYNPQKLMDVYKDSILREFRTYSLLEYSMLRLAQMEFPREDKMQLILEDSVVARQKSEDMVPVSYTHLRAHETF